MLEGPQATLSMKRVSFEEAADLLDSVTQELDLGLVTIALTTIKGKPALVVLNQAEGDSGVVMTA